MRRRARIKATLWSRENGSRLRCLFIVSHVWVYRKLQESGRGLEIYVLGEVAGIMVSIPTGRFARHAAS